MFAHRESGPAGPGRGGRARIHIDTASRAKASQPKLDLVPALLREGDTLVITRRDRLSRSVLHLITWVSSSAPAVSA